MPKFAVPKFNIAAKPNIPDIEQFRKFVSQKIGDVEKVKTPDYENRYRKYYNEIIAVWNKKRLWGKEKSLATLPAKIFNKIPVIAVISFDEKPKLIDDDKFRQAWVELVAKKKDSRHARKIYRSVLRNYDRYQPYLEHIFTYIKPLIKTSSLPLCKKLATLDDRYDLLSPLLVNNITDYIFQHTDESIDDILLDMGIAGSLREGDIGEAIGDYILVQNFYCLGDNDDSLLKRTFEYFSNDAENTLRLAHLRNDLLKSLLGNYLDQDPPAKIKQAIENFTDKYLGDPRGNPKWRGVEAEIMQVVLRWKISVTLRAFFALLDYVARNDDTHDRHWQARKEFWQGYLDQGKITGAWVVLGRACLNNYDFLNIGNLKFGKFSNHKGIQSSHCAIIMQINGRTLTEWSHVGGLRIWERNDEHAPQLYREAYQPKELKELETYEDGFIRHQGNWQEKAREILEGETEFRRW